MSLAFVFPGQGSQKVSMGSSLAAGFLEAAEVFEAADRALGFPLSRLCAEGPESQLALTANTQPAVLATSVAALRVLEAAGVRPDWVAGHSLGEYSAVVAAGGLTLEQAVTVVRRRGEYMQAAVPVGEGAMAAVLLLDREVVEECCSKASQGEIVAPANLNGPGQIVIAGHVAAVERAMEHCKAAGAKRVVRLPVSAPFHCELMKPAQEQLDDDLAWLDFNDLRLPLVNNVDAVTVRRGSDCRDGLVRQVSAPVRWQECIERLASEGVDTFVEVGPGNVLSGLIRKTVRGARVLNVEDPESLERTLGALQQAGVGQ